MSELATSLEPFTPITDGWTATIVNSIIFQQIHILPVGYIYKLNEDDSVTPELVAYETLGSLEYAWIIMAYNNFMDIREISWDHGIKEVLVPNKSALLQLFTSMQEA